MGEAGWAVVVPVKRLAAAKTRLRGVLAADRHADLAMALARDTLSAVRDCAEVAEIQVVTDDAMVAQAARSLGAAVAPEPPRAGLNPAIEHGAALVVGPGRWLAALTADLPALRSADLAAALRAARRRPVRRFVPDTEGTGTVLLTAPPGTPLRPGFGADSARVHAASGAVLLVGHWSSLRRDVDTPADLRAAAALGLGRHTRHLLEQAGARTAGGRRLAAPVAGVRQVGTPGRGV